MAHNKTAIQGTMSDLKKIQAYSMESVALHVFLNYVWLEARNICS